MSGRRRFIKIKKICRQLKLQNMPIIMELFVAFGFVFLITILLSFISFSKFKADKELATFTAISQMNGNAVSKIDEFIQDTINVTKYPLIEGAENSIYNSFVNNLQIFSKTNTNNLEFKKQFDQMAFKILNYKTYTNSVFVFNLKGKSEYKMSAAELLSSGFQPVNEEWFKQSIQAFGKPVIVSTFALPNIAEKQGPVYVFSVSRGILKLTGSEIVGVIMVNCDIAFLKNVYEKMIIVPGQRILIVDQKGNTVYDNIEANIAVKADKELLNLVEKGGLENHNLSMDGKDYLVSQKTSELTGWKVINIIPISELNKNINQLRKTTIIITATLIFIAMLLVVIIARRMVVPMRKLVILMKLFEKGDFDVKIKFTNRNEIGQLAKGFNSMAKKIKKLIREVYTDRIKQKDLEIQMLQNQINPHFLYNTLESIHMMAEINEDDQTAEMTQSLGKILRYSIDCKTEVVRIQDEINNLMDYILLQKIRFSGMFDIIVEIDKEICEYNTIKLILQPLVENAINHGLSSRSKDGIIRVTGARKNNDIVIKVRDNGKGMDQQQVKQINDYINGVGSTMKSIGLKNVNKRIKLHYGDDYGITISSVPGQGTTAGILFPANKI